MPASTIVGRESSLIIAFTFEPSKPQDDDKRSRKQQRLQQHQHRDQQQEEDEKEMIQDTPPNSPGLVKTMEMTRDGTPALRRWFGAAKKDEGVVYYWNTGRC